MLCHVKITESDPVIKKRR